MKCKFEVCDKVEKVVGEHQFEGIVVSVFQKISGVVRVVVEDNGGGLHIYSEENLMLKESKECI